MSKICLGTMTFGESESFWKVIGALGQEASDELVKGSVEAGVNFIDTADVYSEGESEKHWANRSRTWELLAKML